MPLGVPDITYPDSFELPVINPRPAKRLPYFKEHPTPGPGRAKGSHNKVPYDLKRDLVEAAAEVGFDGEGDQGLRGYLKHLAIRYPKCFAHMLGKVLPAYASVDINASVATIREVHITSIPHDHYIVPGAVDASGSPVVEHIPSSEPALAPAPIEAPVPAQEMDEPTTPEEAALLDRMAALSVEEIGRLLDAIKGGPAQRFERPAARLPQQIIPPARTQRPPTKPSWE